MRPCDKIIVMTFDLADKMIVLSDQGDAVSDDDGCGILYGVIRDAAFKIKKLAEAEKNAHIKKGLWNGNE